MGERYRLVAAIALRACGRQVVTDSWYGCFEYARPSELGRSRALDSTLVIRRT